MRRSVVDTLSLSVDRAVGLIRGAFSFIKYSGRPTAENMVLLESYYGSSVACSPLTIYEYMRETHPGQFVYVWAVNEPEKYRYLAEREDTIVCKYLSDFHRMYCCIAKVLVCNCVRDGSLPSRRGQVQLNTWHGGGCYKSVGTAQKGSNPLRNAFYRMRTAKWDYFLSSCRLFSEIELRQQMGYSGEILPWGLPRNDLLVNVTPSDVSAARKELGVPEGVLTVLVAPTFRDDGSVVSVPDDAVLRRAIEGRFGQKAWLMYRGHPSVADSTAAAKFDADFSSLEDSQAVLLAADVLVTDFSSILWDYSLLGRPFFLYAPDYDEYVENRGFCVSPESWGFPFAKTGAQLEATVLKFDAAEHTRAISCHHELFGSYETGKATALSADLIAGVCGR